VGKILAAGLIAILTAASMQMARAEKSLGSCQANVTGAVTVTIVAAATAEQTQGKGQASAMTTLWMKAKSESPAIKGTPSEGLYAAEATSYKKLLTVRCNGQEGNFSINAPYGAQPSQYPEGARTYRLLGAGAKDLAQGDLIFTLNAFSAGKWTVISPKEAGQLKLTRNDKDAVAGNFRVTSGAYTVTGSFSFGNPDQ
jgi:hypothetical protein